MFGRLFKKEFDFYIAGPMRGKPDGNKSVFDMVANTLRKRGFSVWSPAEQNDSDSTFNACMINDINAVIHDCKAIALLPGWKNSLGANTEVLCAYVCGKDIFYVQPVPKDDDQDKFILVEAKSKIRHFLRLPFEPLQKNFRLPEEMNVPEREVLEI